jgi:uncharacterized membrane protein YbhN (UPF0104 family)
MQRRISNILKQLFNPSHKWARRLHRLFRGTISLLALSYIIFRLQKEPLEHWQGLLDMEPEAFGLILLVLLMAPLNWALEAAKWRIMVAPYYPGISLGKAFRAVLAGMTTGIFTPGGFGAFVGRVMSLESGRRVEATVLSLVDGLAQMGITLWMGGLAVMYFLEAEAQTLETKLLLQPSFFPLIEGTVGLGMLLALFCALFPQLPVRLLMRWEKIHGLAGRMISALGQLDRWRLLPVLGLALLRYLVFSSQYLLLLYAFGYAGSPGLGLALISTVLLLKSLVPSIALSELGIRESVALAVMGAFGVAALTAFSSTFLLYLINIILPALLGIRFVNERMRE